MLWLYVLSLHPHGSTEESREISQNILRPPTLEGSRPSSRIRIRCRGTWADVEVDLVWCWLLTHSIDRRRSLLLSGRLLSVTGPTDVRSRPAMTALCRLSDETYMHYVWKCRCIMLCVMRPKERCSNPAFSGLQTSHIPSTFKKQKAQVCCSPFQHLSMVRTSKYTTRHSVYRVTILCEKYNWCNFPRLLYRCSGCSEEWALLTW